MATTDHETELRAALDALETALAIPIIAGELDAWSDQVRAAWRAADFHVRHELTQQHPKQLKQIAKEDPELSAQVENLKAEDAALEQDRAAITRLVDELARVAPIVEPDERKTGDAQAKLVKCGLAFVSRVKKQQVALNTWFQESFTRDHGVAD